MNCTECNGTGEVKEPGYRDNAAKKKSPIPNPGKMAIVLNKIAMYWNLYCPYWPGVMMVIIVACIFCGLHRSISKWDAEDKAASNAAMRAKCNEGVVLVEYYSNGNTAMCVVEKDGTYKPAGLSSSVRIEDRNDKKHIADVAKMMRFDDPSKCEYLHYECEK